MNKSKKHHDEHMDETWLIPYADLLTLLLALFIVLFASSTIDNQKFNAMKESLNMAFKAASILEKEPMVQSLEPVQKDMLNLESIKQKLDKYILDNKLSNELQTGLTDNFVLITIRDHALFDSGSAVIKVQAREKVISIAKILEEYPQYEVIISGHTDNIPIHNEQFESNWDLSSKRALNFMKILLQNKSLEPHRFSAIGYGEYRPIALNDNDIGRAQNRRVEVKVKKPDF